MRIAAFFFFFCCAGGAAAFPGWAVAATSAADPAWRALLHFSGSSSSLAPGAPFFLHPEGHQDPEAELRATRELFARTPGEASCRFPARALYLNLYRPDASDWCERWRKWKEAVRPEGLELAFASAFVNSPSSMYGHTLLKFPRRGATAGQELLDYTLNYGADTGDSGGFAYVWKGLTGGFPGHYSTAPFYLKVREYNFVENRDFWVYPLNVTERELALLLGHAWELREIPSPYFFLRRNCSFYLLEFLEVARPGQNLTAAFPLWAVPMDTIRLLAKDGWIAGPAQLRPSRYRTLAAYREVLSGEEEELVSQLATGQAPPADRPASAGILSHAAYELWRFRTEGRRLDANAQNLETELLARLAQAGPAPRFSYPTTPPEAGHPSARLGLFAGRNRQHGFVELSYRGTLHDLLANPLGYEDFSELTMGDLRLRAEAGRFYVEQFELFKIRSLAPREDWAPRIAWTVRTGLARAKEFSCEAWRCTTGYLAGGAGLSTRMGPFLPFLLAETDLEVGGIFAPDYRWSLGPSAGIFAPLWKGARALVEGEKRWRILGEKRQRERLRAGINQDLHRRWELRLRAEVGAGYREASTGVHFYF
jgi:hypothetical protein